MSLFRFRIRWWKCWRTAHGTYSYFIRFYFCGCRASKFFMKGLIAYDSNGSFCFNKSWMECSVCGCLISWPHPSSGTLFYLTTDAAQFQSFCLTYRTGVVWTACCFRCNSFLRARGNHLRHPMYIWPLKLEINTNWNILDWHTWTQTHGGLEYRSSETIWVKSDVTCQIK